VARCWRTQLLPGPPHEELRANAQQPSQKYTQTKLQKEFRSYLVEFQQLQKIALEKEKASTQAARAALDTQSPSEERSGGDFGQLQEQEQLRLANQDEVDFQESLIIERESEIRNIEQGIGELNELFRDVAHMVRDQGEQLDTIEANVDVTHDASVGAHTNLKQASNYQKSARSKACILLLIMGILLAIVFLAVMID
jgi:t-SNARE complex subunit (syntaxin)